ncbi:MAG: histone family protein [Promethearchaeota archaeon]
MTGSFANARIERLIRSVGAQRVSAEAIETMNEIVTEFGKKLAKHAVNIANHSGRKTVKESDIRLAAER